MGRPLKHIEYSFDDIRRYLQGRMTASEMHEIEKASLQDPFLADAIEGFKESGFENAEQHISGINAFLTKETKESKVIAFNKKTQWLNIAAILIVLAGAGIIATYFLRINKDSQSISQAKNEPALTESFKDSTSAVINPVKVKPDSLSLIAANKIQKETKPISEKKNKGKKETANANLTSNVTQSLASVASAPSQNNNEENINKQELNQPSAKGIATGKDSGFYSGLQKKDTTLTTTPGEAEYYAKSKTPEISNKDLKKSGNGNTLNEVETTAFGKPKTNNKNPDSAMPVGGWQNFNNYVLTKLNEDTAFEFTGTPDELVELEFLIDKNGIPYNITVTKPLDEPHNATAIDILKNGPKWIKPAKKKKASVIINFQGFQK